MNPKRLLIQRGDKKRKNLKIKAKVSKKLRPLMLQRKKLVIGIVVIMIKAKVSKKLRPLMLQRKGLVSYLSVLKFLSFLSNPFSKAYVQGLDFEEVYE